MKTNKPTLEDMRRLVEKIESLKAQKSELKGKMDGLEEDAQKLGYKNMNHARKEFLKNQDKLTEAEEALEKEFSYFKEQYSNLL